MSLSRAGADGVRDAASALLAARVRRMPTSASAAASQRTRELIREGRSIVNLTAGEPDFETPDNVKEAARRAIERGETRYTTVSGTPALRQAIADKLLRENALSYAPDRIIVGPGAKYLIFTAFMATVEEGDEVIVPTPYWVSYPDIVAFCGGTAVRVPTRREAGFKLLPEQLEEAITPRTKWLVLNSPGNPSGAVYSEAELRAIGQVLARHPHVFVLSDDIYEHIVFDGARHATLAAAAPELAARVLVINGVSKAYAMTGWRLGYAAGPAELVRQMGKIQSQSSGNASSVSQAAAVEALSGAQQVVLDNRAEYQARRDLVVEALAAIEGIDITVPGGAFYLFPDCRGLFGRTASTGAAIGDDHALTAHFLEFGVACIAGASYGYPGHVRLSFATSRETLHEGCARIAAACADLTAPARRTT